jgi:plastocyanin
MNARRLTSGIAGAATLSLLGAIAIAPGSVAADPQAHAAVAAKVSVGDNFFSPTKARIAPGGKVKWTNNGKATHNVTFSGGGFRSGNFGPGESAVAKFTRAGKFSYTCTIHPGMTGKVKVVG